MLVSEEEGEENQAEERSVSGEQTGTSTGSREEGQKEPRPRCGCRWRMKINGGEKKKKAALIEKNRGRAFAK